MKKSLLACGFCGCLFIFGMSFGSEATLDQTPIPATNTQRIGVHHGTIYHQVVTTGLAGTLDKVELLMWSFFEGDTDDVFVRIETASDGEPTGTQLATIVDNFGDRIIYPAESVSFDFSSYNLFFDVGDEFAISVQSETQDMGQYLWVRDSDSADLYSYGTAFWNWQVMQPESDFIFTTYVVPVPDIVYSCVGFEPPLNSGAVKVRKKRALPLKAELFDVDGIPITDVDIVAAPVLQVIYSPGSGGESVDVTDDALAVGLGTEGNQFEYNVDKWQYNLKTDNYAAPGSYTVSVSAGDSYVIDPTCEVTFIVE